MQMQTSRNPESTKNPCPTTGTPACLATACSSSSPHTAACQASASQLSWCRTNRLFTLLCTAVQGPLKASPWEHESTAATVATDSITTGTSAAVPESLRENLSGPAKRKEECIKRGSPTLDPRVVRSPLLQTCIALASNENRTHRLAQQEEARVRDTEPGHDDNSPPSPPTTFDTLNCRPQVGDQSSTVIVDQPESCRGLPLALGESSSWSVNRYPSAEAASSGQHDMSCPRAHSFGSQKSSPPMSWSPATSPAPLSPTPWSGVVQPHAVEVSGTPSSMSSSAAFESHMDDIEQYLGQDLEGFGRLSY